MNKNNICVIGAGGCGNKLLDALLDICGVYTPVYTNTSASEMYDMQHIVPERNMLYITNGEGSGRDREVAKQVIEGARPKIYNYFAEKFSALSGIDTFFILASADGGSGSSMAITLPKILKNINNDCFINLVIAMPNLNERETSLQNALETWSEIQILQKHKMINSIQFIDNNKMCKDENEFNHNVMEDLDNSLSINYSEIDLRDSKRVNCENGYKVILNLDNDNKSIRSAVDKAIKNNNFLLPSSKLDCNVLMVSLNEDMYDKEDAKDLFEVYSLDKYDYNQEERNIIVMGGVKPPLEYKELLQVAIDDLKKKRKEREELMNKIEEDDDVKSTPIIKQEPKKKKPKRISRKELAKMMEDSNLW